MIEVNARDEMTINQPDLGANLQRVDQDLAIMEQHAAELAQAEEDIKDSMRKWDREFKDARLHSVPKARKHLRA